MPSELLEISGIAFNNAIIAAYMPSRMKMVIYTIFRPGDKTGNHAKLGNTAIMKTGHYGNRAIMLRSDGKFYSLRTK